jgi:hypothetical protein
LTKFTAGWAAEYGQHLERLVLQLPPDVTRQEYGFKTLKQILIATGLFDPTVSDDGASVLYKSRASHAPGVPWYRQAYETLSGVGP